jgi:hypothetical protein
MLFLLLLLLGSTTCLGQWTNLYGSTTVDYANSVAIGNDGNVLVAGSTFGSLGGANRGLSDILVSVLSPNGTLLYHWQSGTRGMDAANAILVDPDRNYVLVTGYYSLQSTAVFDSAFLTQLYLDPNRSDAPTCPLRANVQQEGRALAILPGEHNFVVAGWTADQTGIQNTVLFFINMVPPNQCNSIRVPMVWTYPFHNMAHAMVVDAANIYVTGFVEGPLAGCTYYGDVDMFLARFDLNGRLLSLHQWGTPFPDVGLSLSLSGSLLFLGGHMAGPFWNQTFHGVADGVLLCYDTVNQEVQWSRFLGTDGWDHISAVVASPNGVLVGGLTYGSLANATYHGKGDMFVSSWTLTGQHSWTLEMGGPETDRLYALCGSTVVGTTLGDVNGLRNPGGQAIVVLQPFCPSGTIHQGNTCPPCPIGFRCPDPELYPNGLPCPPGSGSAANECPPCPLGYACPNPANASSMYACPNGTYAHPNASHCTECPTNFYQNQTGSDACLACPAGFVSSTGASTCVPSRVPHGRFLWIGVGCGVGGVLVLVVLFGWLRYRTRNRRSDVPSLQDVSGTSPLLPPS